MQDYNQKIIKILKYREKEISSFMSDDDNSMDEATVRSFGNEWSKFSKFDDKEIANIGDEYFDIVNDSHISKNSLVLDVGCGTGRWSRYISGKVGFVEAIDPSDAVFAANDYNADINNIRITKASTGLIPFPDESFDFVFCLGVLHHIPDTQKALENIVKKLKINGHILLYLYYKLDNKGFFYKLLFRLSDIIRRIVSSLPFWLKGGVCDFLAVLIYMPLILLSRILKKILKTDFYKKIPLSYYVNKSFKIIRNDALDRFGTPLEKRYTKSDIEQLMQKVGIGNLVFSDKEPYWHFIGKKII